MEINTNSSIHHISRANEALTANAERIASGRRINSAEDDAAGLVISERLTRQIEGFSQSIRNANDGVSYLQTADASVNSLNDGVQRLRELTLQAANGTLNSSDREAINKEALQIREEMQRTVSNSTFNGRPVLSGNDNLRLQVGPGEDDQLELSVDDVEAFLQEIEFDKIDLSSAENAQAALSVLDEAQSGLVQVRADIGAGLNRLDSTINNLAQSGLSAQQSRSRITDADIAREVSELTINQIKRNASIAVQVQANKRGNSLLNLLS